MNQNPFAGLVDRYLYDAELFAKELFGIEAYPWQREELFGPYNRRERYIAIKSGHGVGKSTGLAVLMVHHLFCRFPQKAVCTAPSGTQLWDALWATFKGLVQRLPEEWRQLLDVGSDRVSIAAAPTMSFVSARTCRAETPEALAGVHADETLGLGNEGVLLIVDEASGVPEQVFESALGSMSGKNSITVMTGNPVRTTGFFHDAFGDDTLWRTATVSSLDVPAAHGHAELVERSYGKYSNAYRVRVLGEFPMTESDAIIPLELVQAAIGRDVQPAPTTPVVWGLDVARFGDDRTALAKRQGVALLEPVKAWHMLDTMQVASRVWNEYRETPHQVRPTEINVDAIGIGAGVVDRLRQLGLPARGINVSESPALERDADRYVNFRSALWFKGRQWFEDRMCSLPSAYKQIAPELDLVRQLVTQKYDNTPSDKVFALSKKDMRKKHGIKMQFDLADAFLLTLASDHARLMFGRAANTSWNQPIRRKLKLLA